MYQEATLPLFPMLPAAGRPAPDAEALRRRAGVDYFDLLVREILNKSEASLLPFDWTINPYRGCEFGCVYCYARSTHGFLESTSPDDFESRIFVKRNAAERLTQRLRKRDLRDECECPGQRDERRGAEGPMQAASLRAAMVHVRRCSGHSRISLQIIRSARVRRGAR